MNSKRQTVWLVSMLSLMVVLSAYYLFTDDVTNLKSGSDKINTDQVKLDAAAVSNPNGAKTTDSTQQTSGQTKDAASSTTKQTQTTADKTTASKTDAQVLQQVSAQAYTGDQYFSSEQMKRDEVLAKRTQDLYTIISDSKQTTDAVTKAYNDMSALEDQQVKMASLEEKLGAEFKFQNALVKQENDKWKIVVQADKLEKSQAVSIIDLAITELGVTPDKVSVEFKK